MSGQLKSFLVSSLSRWQPSPPLQLGRTTHSVTLQWRQSAFVFLQGDLLYRVERREKLPPWVVEYSGNKTSKEIENLGPGTVNKFRLRVILKPEALPTLTEKALKHFGSEQNVYEMMQFECGTTKDCRESRKVNESGNHGGKDNNESESKCVKGRTAIDRRKPPVVHSLWSAESWARTDVVGPSPATFALMVRGGYIKQVQSMLEERPALLEMINTSTGYQPLATAAMNGQLAVVKLLLSSGAAVDSVSRGLARTPLHVALLAGHCAVAEMLLDKGADPKVRDVIGVQAVHCAVWGGRVPALRLVVARGGDQLAATDCNGWTPLYRAVVCDASTEMIAELVRCGSDVTVRDSAGLPLISVARNMKTGSSARRLSAILLVDPGFSHEAAAQHFTRVTRTIRTLRTACQHLTH